MAEILIDLSGRNGLGTNFFGDADMVTPRPELRMDDGTGLASGLFNPYLRNGYMAPATNTSTSYTFDTTPDTQLTSVEYDTSNDVVYWADNVDNIYSASSLTDTSLELEDTLDYTSTYPAKYMRLSDMQMYQINGARKLFFSGVGTLTANILPQTDLPTKRIVTVTTSGVTGLASVSARAATTVKPTVIYSKREYVASSASSQTVSVTVPSGTNTALVMFGYNDGRSITSATCNGVAMTILGGRTATGMSVAPYYIYAPTAGTYNVVANYGGAATNRLMHIVVLDNVHQTSGFEGYADTYDSTDLFTDHTFRIISDNQVILYSAYSSEVMESNINNLTQIFDTTNTYGSDGAWLDSNPGLFTQIGYTDLPISAISRDQAAWNMASPSGKFYEATDADNVFLRIADNGFMYAFVANRVHKIDGTTTGGEFGSITKNVLLFPDYFRITDAIDYRSNMYMAVHEYPVDSVTTSLNNYSGRCGLYVWNRVSIQLSSADYIELPGVREIKKIYASPDGVLKLITIADSGLTELREFGYNDSGGVVFPVKKILGIGAFPQVPDGLSSSGDKVTWIGNDGVIYNEKANAVTKLFQAKATGTGTTGLMANVTGGALFYGSGIETAGNAFRTNKQGISFSYLDTATPHLKKIYPFDLTTGSDGAQTPHQGDVYTGVQYIPITSVLRKVRIYNAPITGTGASVIATVKLYFNQSSTAGMTKSISKDEAKRGYVDFAINKPYIHAIQIEVEWATSEPIGEDMYLPSVAIISHDPTTTSSPDSE